MKILKQDHRSFGTTGILVPPIAFGTSALGNARGIVSDQAKLMLCGEWLQHVEAPVFVDTGGGCGAAPALEALARCFDRLDVSPAEAIISHRFDWTYLNTTGERFGDADLPERWTHDCRLLSDAHRPKLIALQTPDEYLATATSPAERDWRFDEFLEAYRALVKLNDTGNVVAVGVAASNWRAVEETIEHVQPDWVRLSCCYTPMQHSRDLVRFMTRLAEQRIPIVLAGIFHGGFLVGGQRCDNRLLNSDDPLDLSRLAWRKAFVALCQGHGVSPAHACIQFALSAPGVVAVAIDTSQPERIAESVRSALMTVPNALWESMREEGLIAS